MKIKPIRSEYKLVAMDHFMTAKVSHLDNIRIINFFFDDKQIGSRKIAAGDLLSDDDAICDIVDEYSKTQKGIFSDIFRRHSDKISLIYRLVEVDIENAGFIINTIVVIEKNKYTIELSINNGTDKIAGTFYASDFSELLEKVRLLTMSLDAVSVDLAKNISEISNNQVEAWIKWKS